MTLRIMASLSREHVIRPITVLGDSADVGQEISFLSWIDGSLRLANVVRIDNDNYPVRIIEYREDAEEWPRFGLGSLYPDDEYRRRVSAKSRQSVSRKGDGKSIHFAIGVMAAITALMAFIAMATLILFVFSRTW